MSKKLTQIKNRASGSDKIGYIPFDPNSKTTVLANYSPNTASRTAEKIQAYEFVPDITVRVPFTQTDYEHFRPNEAIPRKFHDIVKACRMSYYKVGLIRNIVDMMTDFAVEDFKIVHPNKKTEAFLRVWASRVKLHEAVEEFVRHLIIDGNVVVKRITANLPSAVKSEMESKIQASPDIKIYTKKDNISKKEIPWRYMFLNIIAVEWLGGDLAKMAGKRQLAFRLAPTVVGLIRKPTEQSNKEIIENLPADMKKAIIDERKEIVPLDMEKIYISHNKKDSWDDWAPPFLVSVLTDIHYKEKLRMAENSALDGFINVIRIWKLGDHKEGILPDDAAIQKLLNILEANTGGGAMDIIWDTMLELEEHYPPIDKILDSEKYTQVNRDILVGLGIPEVLIGGPGGNFSNSWIQLKTLIERLNYIRGKAREWLSGELSMVCDAIDEKIPAIPHFNHFNLEDENINKKLIIGLLDRGIISVEAVLNTYGENFLLEMERIKNQKEYLDDAEITIKSPFDAKKGDVGESGGEEGRPSQTEDVYRDERTPNPRANIESRTMYALDAIDAIDEYIIPIYMEELGVTNARKLTNDQKDEIDNARRSVLSSLKYGDSLLKDDLVGLVSSKLNPNIKIIANIKQLMSQFNSVNTDGITLNQKKRIEAIAWANISD